MTVEVAQPVQVINIAPAAFVTPSIAHAVFGYTVKAIERKIERGIWREGLEWVKDPDGRRMISIKGVERWVAAAAG